MSEREPFKHKFFIVLFTSIIAPIIVYYATKAEKTELVSEIAEPTINYKAQVKGFESTMDKTDSLDYPPTQKPASTHQPVYKELTKQIGRGTVYSYSGETINGIANGVGVGKGKATWFGNPDNFTYQGDWKNGQFDGKGKLFYETYWTYEGMFTNGSFNGHGILTMLIDGYPVTNCPECKKYIGSWKVSKKDGYGKCYDANGKLIYEGTFTEDRPSESYPNR